MNWWSLVTMAYEVVKEAPHLVGEVKSLIDKINSHRPVPDEVLAALPDEVRPG